MKSLDKHLTHLCAWLLFAMSLSIFIQVLTRYIFQTSFPVLHYSVVMSMTWMTMLGTAVAVYQNEHFAMDMWSRRPPSFTRSLVMLIRDFCMLLTIACLIYAGWEFAKIGLIKNNPATELPEIYGYSSVLTGALLMLAFYIAKMRLDRKEGVIAKMHLDRKESVAV